MILGDTTESNNVTSRPEIWNFIFARYNSYFDRPKYRFPYYSPKGIGASSRYGYGNQDVFNYTEFSILEGHYK